jgi:hypothetical protein
VISLTSGDIVNISRSVLLAFTALLLFTGGCARQTEVIKLYDNSAAIEQRFQRLLVVAVANDDNSRRRLEELITENLTSAGIGAVAAYSETGMKKPLLQEELNAAARNTDSDGLLITHVASVDTRVDVKPGQIKTISECRGGDPIDFFLYDHRELKEPDSVRLAHTVVVVTSLYNAASGERIWTIQSTCFEKASMDEVLREEAEAIVRQLQRDKLVN